MTTEGAGNFTGFTATRDQLVDAIACLTVRVRTSGPAAGMINAESMADAIIAALHAATACDRWFHADGSECKDPGDHKCSATWEGSPS